MAFRLSQNQLEMKILRRKSSQAQNLAEFHAWTRFLPLGSSSLCAFCKRINVFEVVRRKEGRTTPLYRATTTTPDRRTCFRVRRQLKASLCNGRRSSGHWVCISLVLPTVSFPPSPSLSLSRGSREKEREGENGLEPVLKGPVCKVREVRRPLSIHSTPPPHRRRVQIDTSSAERVTRVSGASRNVVCRKSRRRCLLDYACFGKSTGPGEVLVRAEPDREHSENHVAKDFLKKVPFFAKGHTLIIFLIL